MRIICRPNSMFSYEKAFIDIFNRFTLNGRYRKGGLGLEPNPKNRIDLGSILTTTYGKLKGFAINHKVIKHQTFVGDTMKQNSLIT